MTTKKTIAVVGATGAQGGALVRAIMADPDGPFTVRAITRKPDSPQAQALASAGAEVVDWRLRPRRDDEGAPSTAPTPPSASPTTGSTSRPSARSRRRARWPRRRRSAGVAHAVWSTLEDTRRWVPLDDQRMPTLMGKYKVPHFDTKGEADGFFRELGVPTTFLLTSFYWENFIYFGLGTEGGRGRRARADVPARRREAAGHRGRGHRQVRVCAASSGVRSSSARPSASPAGT